MKMRAFVVLCGALGMSSLANADGATNSVMGQIDAILSYCSQVNPASKADYANFRRTLVSSFGGATFDSVSGTPEYQGAYASTRQMLGKLPLAQGIHTCRGTGFTQADSPKPTYKPHGN